MPRPSLLAKVANAGVLAVVPAATHDPMAPAQPPGVMRSARSVQKAPARENTPAGLDPRGPRDLCGDRNFFALAVCMSRQCETPRWQAHPQCADVRRAAQQRQRRMEQ